MEDAGDRCARDSRDVLRAWIETGAADAGLAAELDALVPEMVDDRDLV